MGYASGDAMGVGADAVRRARYVGRLVGWGIVATSAGATIGGVALGVVARAYVAWLGAEGAPAAIGGWSFTAAYAVLGLAAGGAIGLTIGAARGLGQVEADLRPALQAESARVATDAPGGGPRVTTAALRKRFERLADEVAARVGVLPVPGAAIVARLVRARLRRCLVDDFLAACERDGVTSVGPQEIARWLASRGPAYLLAPAHAQLRVWRLVASTLMILAAAAPLVVVLGRGG